MSRTTPREIRNSYTPLERAILTAYLGHPDLETEDLDAERS